MFHECRRFNVGQPIRLPETTAARPSRWCVRRLCLWWGRESGKRYLLVCLALSVGAGIGLAACQSPALVGLRHSKLRRLLLLHVHNNTCGETGRCWRESARLTNSSGVESRAARCFSCELWNHEASASLLSNLRASWGQACTGGQSGDIVSTLENVFHWRSYGGRCSRRDRSSPGASRRGCGPRVLRGFNVRAAERFSCARIKHCALSRRGGASVFGKSRSRRGGSRFPFRDDLIPDGGRADLRSRPAPLLMYDEVQAAWGRYG